MTFLRVLLPPVLSVLLVLHGSPLSAGEPADAGRTTPLENTSLSHRGALSSDTTFVSRGDSVTLLLQAVAAQMRLPAVVSSKAQKKRVEGSFGLHDARGVLDQVSRDLGLVWYSDAQTLYVYDAAETRTAVGHLQHTSVAVLNDFLRRTRLADARYPVRGGSSDGTFYIAGPPVYVDIVLNAARYLDELYRGADVRAEHVEVIALRNSFAQGRRYGQRSVESTLPGMAESLARVLSDAGVGDIHVRHADSASTPQDASGETGVATRRSWTADSVESAPGSRRDAGAVPPTIVVAYPETNSLIVRGTLSGIQKVKQLVAELDLPRRQIELSLWIIDVQKNEFDSLGVKWSGGANLGGRLGVGINGSSATLDGGRFLASVWALSERGLASIVSRPVLLTQENVLAHFDSNSTFYARLQAERSASLESVTYGTLVSVLPRVSDSDEVEMQLKVEDGTESGKEVEGLPIITRTTIDTVARVPHSLSLLVGGYTRHEQGGDRAAIPGLRRIPVLGRMFRHRAERRRDVVRVFLIQPRVLDASDFSNDPAYSGLIRSEPALPEHLRNIHDDVREALDGPH